ncbi:unnamed protein product [Kluyveromyces dobzhanskii CBS 2104]|uniref:WGS project CCBQ000000000 data, contig 00017 n=1 Tax=Kluyveromyces dobzhanskii CBS 2104 TaxID=1427455 RepID=A0A0A8L8P7_9SACH|nr:unnamed protein product [Kluyveromyces dobzhanskii CBS 2104]
MDSLSGNEDVSSSSGGSLDDEILRRPGRQDSFFKEEHLSSTGTGDRNQFSVILNDSYIRESSDESRDRSISKEGHSIAYSRASHSNSNSNSNSNSYSNSSSSTSSQQRRLANSRNSQYMRYSTYSAGSGSAYSPQLRSSNLQSEKFSSANTSKDTVSTDALLDRPNSSGSTPLVHSFAIESPQQQTSNRSGNDEVLQDLRKDHTDNTKRSSKTISTSALISSDYLLDDIITEESETELNTDTRNLVSPFAPTPAESVMGDDTQDVVDDYEYDDTKPAIEEAVQLFKLEAKKANMLDLRNNDHKNVHRRQTSLLSSILVPPPMSGNKSSPTQINTQEQRKLIPVMRKVSGNLTPTARQGHFPAYEQQTANADPPTELLAAPPLSVLIEKKAGDSDYQSDTLDYIRASRKRLDEFNDLERNIPIQRVDVSSMNSEESKMSIWSHFSDLFSITRLILLFIICLVVPPLFFFVGFGDVTGFNDEKLMKFIMHSQHRYGLMPGFIWAIDLSWLRRVFVISGIIEIFALFACIGVGFGVGLSR